MKKKITIKSTKKLHKKAWTLMSKYIRLFNADWRGNVPCYTCNKVNHYKKMHAGHFKHNRLDFDARNVHPQCSGCNTFRGGKLDVYATNLVRDYGSEILNDLEKDAEYIYSFEELEEIIIDLTKRLEKL